MSNWVANAYIAICVLYIYIYLSAWKLNRYMYESACTSPAKAKTSDLISTLQGRLQEDIGVEELAHICTRMQLCLKDQRSYHEAVQSMSQSTLDLLPCVIQLIQLQSLARI